MPAIKSRLRTDGYEEPDIDLILGSKNAILEVALNKMSTEEYDAERKTAAQNFLKNLAELISSM